MKWSADWQQRIRNRLHNLGCESVGDYLALYPGEPYTVLAQRLGDDVAAVQLSQMQIQEVYDDRGFRNVAMDSLARELTANLPLGWQRCSNRPLIAEPAPFWKHLAAKGPTVLEEEKQDRLAFQLSGAYAYWLSLLQSYDSNAEVRADRVWEALKAISPPAGWLPSGPDDPLLVAAFAAGWDSADEPQSPTDSLPS